MKRESLSYILSFFVVIIVFAFAITYTGKEDTLENFHQVEIEEGESLWSIAEKYEEHASIPKQEFVKWIQDKNNLATSVIKPGEVVFVPIDKKQFFNNLASDE
ncbi:LysM peptidoglycan-binding domain-containing protein [Metabacillus herbersteinensis]|uniref:LysM peptidoglycan-binding domain-containing protein n=1 Tax=Metabacillus herbersteinensis TaxID=283816 RepID=A0ABV6GD98_9BACI